MYHDDRPPPTRLTRTDITTQHRRRSVQRSPAAATPSGAQRTSAAAGSDQHDDLAKRLRSRHRTRYERIVKPVLDRVLAGVLIAMLLPIMVVVALVVLFDVGRPLLLRQWRGGIEGRPFRMLKFRTMLPDRRVSASVSPYDGPDRRRTHKSPDDPRHTRRGRIIRKFSLDELPQLFNVVRGQMSLVGPRPEMMTLVGSYEPWQHCRHLVKPGLTGLWQVTERGSGRMMHDCIELDLDYISKLSLRRDLAILARTPLAILRSKGVI